MALLTNNAEGGSDTVNVDTTNSGGTSGDAFDTVNKGASGIVKFSTIQKRDLMAYQLSTGASAAAVGFRWTTKYTDIPEDFGRVYLYMEDRPSSGHGFVQWLTSAAVLQCQLQILNTGVLRATDTIGADNTDGAYAMLADTFYRIEWKATKTSTLVAKIYQGDSGTLEDEITRDLTGTLDYGEFRLGIQLAAVDLPTVGTHYYVDNIVSGNTAYPGPAEAPLIARPLRTVRGALRW